MFLRESQYEEESIRGKDSLEGCTKKPKQQLEELLQAYKDVFREPKGLPPKRELEHEIQQLPDSPLPNIGLYMHSVIEASEVKKQLQQLLEQGVI